MLALVGEDFLSPHPGETLQSFNHHALGLGHVGAKWGNLVGPLGAPHANVHPPVAEDVQRCHPGRHVQGMMHRSQHHTEPQAHLGSAVGHDRQGHFRRAGMGELGQKMVLHQPHLLKSHLLGVGHLLNGLPQSVVFRSGRPGFGHLKLEKHSKAHW